MLVDLRGVRLFWTKQAVAEAFEDGFNVDDISMTLDMTIELPEFDPGKRRGLIKVGPRYLTLIYKKMTGVILIIACWESNRTDRQAYDKMARKR
jgi:hypothetical protein